jgi:AcrR family transcriptional regulator
MSRQERKESITRRRKQQILDAALAVFSRKGFAGATTADIARETGVAEGTIYNYFQSKRELLVAVIRNFAITEPFLNLFEHAEETDYPAFLTAVLENRMDFVEGGEKSRLPLMMSELLRDPELKRIFNRQVIKPIMTKMEKFYEARAATGYFRPLDTSVITRALGGMVLGLLLLTLLEGENSPLKGIPRQKLAAEVVQLVLKGIQKD